MRIYDPPCERCGARVLVEVRTDLNGRTFDVLIEACPHERKRRGVCKHCPRRVRGVVGKSQYCARCREDETRRANRRYHRSAKGRRVNAERQRRLYWQNPAKHRDRKRDEWNRRAA